MKNVERTPTDKMYIAGMAYLIGKGTNWCINDLFQVMWDAAPQNAVDKCIGCTSTPVDCPGLDKCEIRIRR